VFSIKTLISRSSLGRFLAAGAAAIALIACESAQGAPMQSTISPTLTPTTVTVVQPIQTTIPSPEPTQIPAVPTATPTPVSGLLSIGKLPDLRSGPIDIPLEIKIPSLKVSASVLGVGLTPDNVMDTPKGPANDPIWEKLFWYRGSGIPGEAGTATIAGHYNGREGIPAVFYDLSNLRRDDTITIRNTSNGKEVTYKVTDAKTYTVKQTQDPQVLATIYGEGPVSGKGPQPSADGLSHITLITCSGKYVNGSFDHRLVVYATEVS